MHNASAFAVVADQFVGGRQGRRNTFLRDALPDPGKDLLALKVAAGAEDGTQFNHRLLGKTAMRPFGPEGNRLVEIGRKIANLQ
jgi:hypothetical protein